MEDKQNARTISMQISLHGGHTHELEIREDAPELVSLFQVLARRGTGDGKPEEQFFQIPLDGGRSACSFSSAQLVSIITKPPVVIHIETPAEVEETASVPNQQPAVLRTPGKLIIDDFLSKDEHHDMLAFAIANEDKFKSGTVEGSKSRFRQNKVIMNFHEFAHSTLICNRLLTWLPQIVDSLDMDLFAVETVESQLTASNDGHFYGLHLDKGGAEALQRTLSCVYYFFQKPRPFTGGALRLYDSWLEAGNSRPADTFQEIQPVSNRLVVFQSDSYHQLMHTRCPSREFKDSRFAITSWIRQLESPNPDATFGWGHLHCGQIPANFNRSKDSS